VEEIHDGYKTKSHKSNTCSVKELIVDGVSITNPTDLPDTFNEHFSTVGPELPNEIPSAANSNKGILLISTLQTRGFILIRLTAITFE